MALFAFVSLISMELIIWMVQINFQVASNYCPRICTKRLISFNEVSHINQVSRTSSQIKLSITQMPGVQWILTGIQYFFLCTPQKKRKRKKEKEKEKSIYYMGDMLWIKCSYKYPRHYLTLLQEKCFVSLSHFRQQPGCKYLCDTDQHFRMQYVQS